MCARGKCSTIEPKRIGRNSAVPRSYGTSCCTFSFHERIASEGHKARLCEAFSEIIDGNAPEDIDDHLKAIRLKLQQFLPDDKLDFLLAVSARVLVYRRRGRGDKPASSPSH